MKYSFLAIDVGFDLRLVGTPIKLPKDITCAEFHPTPGNTLNTAEVRGNRERIVEALQTAGYQVSPESSKLAYKAMLSD